MGFGTSSKNFPTLPKRVCADMFMNSEHHEYYYIPPVCLMNRDIHARIILIPLNFLFPLPLPFPLPPPPSNNLLHPPSDKCWL